MVAYSYKARFVSKIEEGSKRQTMRNERKRHARPGEEIQNYYAMRTKQCRLVGRYQCTAITPVRLEFGNSIGFVKIEDRPLITRLAGLNSFAIRDGFADWDDLCDFWNEEHNAITTWTGVLIEWTDFKKANDDA